MCYRMLDFGMLPFFAALLFILPAASQVLAGEESHVYDAQGRYRGRATVNPANPKQTNLYDAKGRYVGRVMTGPDGEARLYDRQGRYKGRATGGNPPVPPGQEP